MSRAKVLTIPQVCAIRVLEQHGFSISQMAELLNIPKSTVHECASGKTYSDVDMSQLRKRNTNGRKQPGMQSNV